jgi:hypothetical protein
VAYNNKKIKNKYQLLVWLFLAKPLDCTWPKEVKIAKTLLSKYPDLKFWRSLDLGYKLNSLAYFLSEKGKALLYNKNKFYKKEKDVKLREAKTYSLEQKKLGEDKKTPNKKLKLLEFINHGKKEKN